MDLLEGTQQLYAGGMLLTPVTSFAGAAPFPGFGVTEETETRLFPLPAVYYTRHLGRRWAAGLGLNAPYGLGVEWKDPDQFTGRYIVTKADLQGVNLGLSAAYEISPMLSVAAGGDTGGH